MDRQISLQIDGGYGTWIHGLDRWRYMDTWIRQMAVHGFMDQIDGEEVHGYMDQIDGGTWIHGLDRWRYMGTWIKPKRLRIRITV